MRRVWCIKSKKREEWRERQERGVGQKRGLGTKRGEGGSECGRDETEKGDRWASDTREEMDLGGLLNKERLQEEGKEKRVMERMEEKRKLK
ncbi:hypothetical protein NDU88_000971 [Pleurodeles waltl]|uniref:Uncharacterized protein n=1 Tax=Pleurodeles waltl TaxID=8319 RepID=A0AAV7KZG4_PLEWA|nr:hypothetical protein NDU88_000971 [Pleurodeles waltl]